MQATDDLRQQLEAIDRANGRESLFYFAKFVLGYDRMQLEPHGAVCKFAEGIARGDRFGMDLEPRGSFKTTQFSQALPIWLIINNPEIRILLDSAVLQNSIDNLGVIQRHFEGNDKLRYLFGDYVGNHWTNEAITISKRKNHGLKEPTVRCASVERVQVGPHYDVIIADDLVSFENSATQEGRRQIKDHFKLLFSLLEPNGILIVVGTRWNYDDLYGMIVDEFPEFKTHIMQAIDVKGKLYFPEGLSQEFLDAQKRRQGYDIYNCQYQNDPAPEDKDSKFQASWFERFERLPEINKRYGFIAIDPGGEKKGSDEWAIMTGYVDDQNILFLDRLLRGNFRSDQAWEILFNLVEAIKPLYAVGLETTGGQKYLLESLNDQMRARNKFFTVIPLAHARDSKEYRILRLQPRYQSGAIKHSSQMGPLEEQLRRFPKGKDDIADVAAMIAEIVRSPTRRADKEASPRSTDEYFLRIHRDRFKQNKKHALLGDQW